ncbi:uncharacterized protein LOC133380604 isoform X1 [Rhineura floridana]|uniref:uncharacterized protein LOC133380604 isoform X1 n=1 Tax=Rhineura floridana TaxID=261503 RepID=UPI002AC7F17E|nr:uncharacterized protein LOC133380604 isoform X1 [Rhineura floridana]
MFGNFFERPLPAPPLRALTGTSCFFSGRQKALRLRGSGCRQASSTRLSGKPARRAAATGGAVAVSPVCAPPARVARNFSLARSLFLSLCFRKPLSGLTHGKKVAGFSFSLGWGARALLPSPAQRGAGGGSCCIPSAIIRAFLCIIYSWYSRVGRRAWLGVQSLSCFLWRRQQQKDQQRSPAAATSSLGALMHFHLALHVNQLTKLNVWKSRTGTAHTILLPFLHSFTVNSKKCFNLVTD